MSRKFEVVSVGASKRTAELGTDEAGAVTRIDNAIARIGKELDAARQALGDVEKQIENSKAQIAKPFDKEDDL